MSDSLSKKVRVALICVLCFSTSCSNLVNLPTVETILPSESGPHRVSAPSQALDFNLDGTLSMQGFARPTDGKFSQLLQDLDLSFSALWKPDQITYQRFGSIIEPVAQRPFYVAASTVNFFKGTKEYATTRIDKVFRASKLGHLSIVMTDLFEQDLDISSIQQSLKASSFPERSSLAIWQWSMPFSGSIFDFDFRVHEGRNYTGNRYLYMLALGSAESIEKLRAAVDRNVTVGKQRLLLLSDQPAKSADGWFAVTQIRNAALKSRSNSDATSMPYSVYRVSRGCSTAELTARPQLAPAFEGSPELSKAGTYSASLRALTNDKGSWSSRGLADPEVHSTMDGSGHELLKIEVKCPDIVSSNLALLRVRRVGTGNDLVLPPWIASSSATSMDFNKDVRQNQSNWGQKTLNLLPFVRGLASTATDRSAIAVAYIYLVAN